MNNFDSNFLEKLNNKDKYISLIHMADSHSGYRGNASKYNEYAALRIDKTDEQGINIRQSDIDRSFEQIIDLALDVDVDVVLHAGDGWDAVGYPERTVDNAYTKNVTRLSKKNIEYVEIVGNHNLPKKIGKGCFLESLGRYPQIHTVYKGVYEKVTLLNGLLEVHCVPSTFNQSILDDSLDAINKNVNDNAINIGLGHFGVTNIEHYAKNAENTLITTLDKLLSCKVHYFALGDYHAATTFTNHIRYSGSIERLGFGEVNNRPQVFVICIDKETKEVFVEPYYLDVRKMIDLPAIEADEKSIEIVNEEIIKTLSKTDLADAIVRLRIYRLPMHLKSSIDVESIEEYTKNAMFFKLELRDKKEDTTSIRTSEEIEFDGILEGWLAYMEKVEDDGSFDKVFATEHGYEKLSEVLER